MRASIVIASLVALLASPIAFGQQNADEHAGHHPPETGTASPQSEQGESHDGKLQQDMQKMQQLMGQILATQDPKLRSELLRQHLQAMRDQIKAMRKAAAMKMEMKGGGMMGGEGKGDAAGKGEKDGTTEGKKGGMMGGMMMMHKRMEQRVDLVEQLLEQMVEHEAAEADFGGR